MYCDLPPATTRVGPLNRSLGWMGLASRDDNAEVITGRLICQCHAPSEVRSRLVAMNLRMERAGTRDSRRISASARLFRSLRLSSFIAANSRRWAGQE